MRAFVFFKEVDMQVLLALALIFSQASSGMLYFARQVPEDVSIKVDGDLSDWGWMAPTFCSKDEFTYCSSTEDDFDVVAWVAWSPGTNMLYHALKAKDDELLTLPLEERQRMWRWDDFEIYVDADCSGGDYREPYDSRQAQQYYLYCLPGGKGGHLGIFGPEGELGWSLRPPYAEYFVKYEDGVIYYEVGMRLWDWLDVSPERSREHILKAGDVIGWKIVIKDRDDTPTPRPWILKEGSVTALKGSGLIAKDSWRDAGSFARLKLLGSDGEISRLELEAWRMREQGRYDEALEVYKKALEVWDGMKGKVDGQVWASGRVLYLRKIASCYNAMGNFNSYARSFLRSLDGFDEISSSSGERYTSGLARLKLAVECYWKGEFDMVRSVLKPLEDFPPKLRLKALQILASVDIEQGKLNPLARDRLRWQR